MEEEEIKVSKYSSGINILKRIDTLWKDTHTHSRSGLYQLWNADLDRIWLELARDLKEKNKDESLTYSNAKEKFDGFETRIEELGKIPDGTPSGFKELTSDQIKNRNKFYNLLMEKQLFLARLENALGKGTTLEDEDEDDF